ncbi:MAG: GHKL domain-containing protein [Lachnospiraceae bacterium]|nr:GHKL domain-containing protein [Lachnospiraceae bacterium]
MKILFVSIMLYLFVNIFYMKINLSINNEDFIQIIFFIILFFLAINEWQKAIAEAERKKTQLEMNKLYYDAYDELLTLVRERQHDLKNHISAILGMVYTIDNYDELVRSQKEYCNKVMEKSKETKLLLTAGNPLIAGFLYRKIQEAKEKGIDVEYKVIAGSSDFYIPEYELVEMLGILLDNAIEAEEESEITPKEVRVEIGDRKWQFAFLVENTSRVFSQDEIDKFFQKDFTSKGKGHGIGLTKLKKMVHEMDGDLIVTNSERSGINYLQFGVIINKKE